MGSSQDLQGALDAMPDSPPGVVECPPKDSGGAGAKPKNPCAGLGMSDDAKEKAFATGFKKLAKDWKTLTVDQRQARIRELANAAKATGVPDVTVRPTPMASAGQLSFSNWRLDLREDELKKSELTDAEAKEFADTVYHETRHAEQWYLMAQKYAAEGKTADQISAKLGIPKSVAESAVKDPLKKDDPRQACVDALFESVYGSKAAARNKTLTDLAAKREANKKAQEAYEKLKVDKTATKKQKDDANQAWVKAYDDYKKVRGDYLNLPEEADAWETAGKMQKQW